MEETPEMVEGAFYFFQPPKANLVVHVFKKLEETIFITEGNPIHLYTLWRFFPEKSMEERIPLDHGFEVFFQKSF